MVSTASIPAKVLYGLAYTRVERGLRTTAKRPLLPWQIISLACKPEHCLNQYRCENKGQKPES